MLKTILGNINVIINGENLDYTPVRLSNIGKNYVVDGRYKIIINKNKMSKLENIIECVLDAREKFNLDSGEESGEGLALISFTCENIKLSIGVEGDICGVKYEYMKNGLRIKISKEDLINQLNIFVAWITMENVEQQENYTWFAADPTLEY